MTFATDIRTDFSGCVTEYGTPIRVKYYIDSYSGADYDNRFLTSSGSAVWSKAIIFCMDGTTADDDYKLLEQGAIRLGDMRAYVMPHINLSGPGVKFGVGSPVHTEYSVVPLGVHGPNIQDTNIFMKVYLRILNNGSFVNEY